MKVCTDACIFGAWMAKHLRQEKDILDIGSGTGLLMMILAQTSNAHIHGIELNKACFIQLEENIAQYEWRARLKVFNGDVRSFTFPNQYQLIVSNPPFYENDLLSDALDEQLAKHSSELSFQQLITAIDSNLSEDGRFAVLVPFNRREYFDTLASAKGFVLHESLSIRHSPLHPFFRAVLLFGRAGSQPVLRSDLAIRKPGNNEYTDEFIELLKEYYLHL